MELALARRSFAEEIRVSCNLETAAIVEAFAAVPRERFLPRGPWRVVRGPGAGEELTPDDDPRHVYHNVSVAIDPKRQLFNGAPGVVAPWIDALRLSPGHRVLHVGCGLGYYSALLASVVGPDGRVVAVEVDEDLAEEAKRNLATMPWVDVRYGDGRNVGGEQFEAILVHAGVTHPLDQWLDAATIGGRLLLPLTATMPAMSTLGKGKPLVLTKAADGSFDVQSLNFVAIYSAVGLRDDALNAALGEAFIRAPSMPVNRLRRDAHDPSSLCWLHGETFCLTA